MVSTTAADFTHAAASAARAGFVLTIYPEVWLYGVKLTYNECT